MSDPHLPFKAFSLSLSIIIIFSLFVLLCECTDDEYPTRLEKRATPKKSGKPKPRQGTSSTTMKPGASSSTTIQPGASTTTRKGHKPPTSSTRKPNENTTNPVTNETRPLPMPLEGFEFVGFIDDIGYWVTEKEGNKETAVLECEKLSQISGSGGTVASLLSLEEISAVDKMLTDYRDKSGTRLEDVLIANIVEISPAGRTIMSSLTLFGKRVEDITDTFAELFIGKKPNKRSAQFLSNKRKRRVLVTRAKRQAAEDEGDFEDPDDEAMARGSIPAGPPNSITAKQVHYPWLADWKMEGDNGACSPDLTGCKPRNCTVTTSECKVIQKNCFVDEFTQCTEVNTTACSAVCAKCNVTQPNCYQMDHMCTLIEPRKCTVSDPECNVVTPNCTVSRKPCVTKYPECHVAKKNKTCEVPKPCARPQGSECHKQPRKCRDEELAAGKPEGTCFNYICDSKAICLTPTYCVEDHVICPYPTTFCPPEVVHCPQPFINCSKPNTTCTDPVFNCPAPQIKCEEPYVYCSAPTITCPTVITQCENPQVQCLPPKINCPPPVLECDEPTPCEIPPSPPCPPSSVRCEDDCNCIKLTRLNVPKQGLNYERAGTTCDALLKALCLANVSPLSRKAGGGSTDEITEAPKRKG